MDITDEGPFHSTRWNFLTLKDAFNFSELGEEMCEGVTVNFVWDMSNIDVICAWCLPRDIFEGIRILGTEIAVVGSFPWVKWFVDGHEMIHNFYQFVCRGRYELKRSTVKTVGRSTEGQTRQIKRGSREGRKGNSTTPYGYR